MKIFLSWRNIFVAVSFLLVIGIGLYFFAPFVAAKYWCSICGKDKIEFDVLGIRMLDREKDTDLSNLYDYLGLEHHEHQWKMQVVNRRNWFSQTECYDCSLFMRLSNNLDVLLEARKKTDHATFDDLVKAYKLWKANPDEDKTFWPKYHAITSEPFPDQPEVEQFDLQQNGVNSQESRETT